MIGAGAPAGSRLPRALCDGDKLGEEGGGRAGVVRSGGGGTMLCHRDEAAPGR